MNDAKTEQKIGQCSLKTRKESKAKTGPKSGPKNIKYANKGQQKKSGKR